MTKPSENSNLPEQPAAASDARFRALVTATSDVIYSMSADWSVMGQLDGRGFLTDTQEPMSGWIEKYIHPDDFGKVKAAIAEAIRDKKIFQLEHRVLQADGSTGWTSSRAVPILDDKGDIIEWFGTASDITEQKRAEEAVREEKERSEQQRRLYETITSSTPDLIYVFGLDYRFQYANEALLTMWGKTRENAVGKSLLENGYEPWHAEMHEREIDKIRETKTSIRGEVSFPHAILGRRVYDYILNPVLNAQGEVEAVAGTTRDITDIKNAETAITESETRFRVMAESTDVMISVGDEMGKTIYFNQAWATITGRPAAELLYYGWLDLIHPDDKEQVMRLFAASLKDIKPWQYEFRLPAAGNAYRWLLTRSTPRFRSDGSFAGYISSTVDITEIKENEQRKNAFISMVSHELKTPLTSAISYVQVSQKKATEYQDTQVAGMLERAGKQLAKMTRMINGFLNVSRLESGKIHMDLQEFDITQLVGEAVEEEKAAINNHVLVFNPCNPMMVKADREKIGQVISNLISNAVKYSPSGSAIHITCSHINGGVQVSVADEGMGITAEDLPRLFERYYRVKGTENNHISGFGIGLYLCSEIIKGHGGEIWAESEVDKGSVFYFSLPG
ncbi:PAS domain-containing sensor histidine kinase [Mucilaginibacter hurinus]|uniref:histidine kinase n=1 Tax=Mucilaginibacter hurinus TaxID=2201324 RepID=A0A367GSD7_9SPHI|nr:PAS domain S-box protein [Mucilaginibacter hurinus]RCH56352.1 PAS domain-containing sensor histidine kinase [Mucilaginibacter hurinus]